MIVFEKRKPKIVKIICAQCGEEFETDIDLDNRLKVSGFGTSPILRFPNLFWDLCDKCKEKKYYYTTDTAVAFHLIEGKCTEHDLLGVGLNRKDLERFRQAGIEKYKLDYRESSMRKNR